MSVTLREKQTFRREIVNRYLLQSSEIQENQKNTSKFAPFKDERDALGKLMYLNDQENVEQQLMTPSRQHNIFQKFYNTHPNFSKQGPKEASDSVKYIRSLNLTSHNPLRNAVPKLRQDQLHKNNNIFRISTTGGGIVNKDTDPFYLNNTLTEEQDKSETLFQRFRINSRLLDQQLNHNKKIITPRKMKLINHQFFKEIVHNAPPTAHYTPKYSSTEKHSPMYRFSSKLYEEEQQILKQQELEKQIEKEKKKKKVISPYDGERRIIIYKYY